MRLRRSASSVRTHQARNLGLSVVPLLQRYPTKRVREIHISGGSWRESRCESHKGLFRYDSHDGPVPDEVFALVQPALRCCPNVEVVIFESRGANLDMPEDRARYQSDFLRLCALVESAHE